MDSRPANPNIRVSGDRIGAPPGNRGADFRPTQTPQGGDQTARREGNGNGPYTPGTQQPQTGAPQLQQGMAITNCANCDTTLTYPQKSLYIQCPKCSHTMNPQAPNTNYINCFGCTTLLSHPPTSLTIQCPKCLMIMELPVRGSNATPEDHNFGKESRKRRKDPNAPRRASNAYMIFCKERRAQLKEDRPDLAFGKLGAKLGEMWREMSTEARKPYEAKAAMDRERFKREMETYNAELADRRKRTKIDMNSEGASNSPAPRNGSTMMTPGYGMPPTQPNAGMLPPGGMPPAQPMPQTISPTQPAPANGMTQPAPTQGMTQGILSAGMAPNTMQQPVMPIPNMPQMPMIDQKGMAPNMNIPPPQFKPGMPQQVNPGMLPGQTNPGFNAQAGKINALPNYTNGAIPAPNASGAPFPEQTAPPAQPPAAAPEAAPSDENKPAENTEPASAPMSVKPDENGAEAPTNPAAEGETAT